MRVLAGQVVLAVMVLSGCAAAQRGDGLDPAGLPLAVRADYEVFAARCSRCHSLARPLSARVTELGHWRMYVTRMRRQPGSGIAPEDEAPLLRFLEYYSARERARGRDGSP